MSDMSQTDILFDKWWSDFGSGITPSQEDDMEEHAKRVAWEAWFRSKLWNNDNARRLHLLADIRAAAGDPEGKLMLDELVQYTRQMRERLEHAEDILDTLTATHYLDLLDDDRRMSEQVMGYWHKWSKEDEQ